MIIQIRGTSGSGKTTVMREIMSKFRWNDRYIDGRKKPILYNDSERHLAVLGHYESTCGGCDNVGSARSVYEALELTDARIVLAEGLLLSEDVKWTTKMAEERRVVVFFLTTGVEECIDRVKRRRKEAGNLKPLNESNTRNRVAVIERARGRLIEGGRVECKRASSSQASKLVLKLVRDYLGG